MSDDKPHRSRTAWPGPMSIAGIEPGHDHQLPAPLVQRTRLLTRAVVIFGVCLAAIGTLLVLLILDRSEARDRENERTNQRINDALCDLLDTLPEGGLLDRPRHKYGCGPGLPVSQLTPDERAQIAARIPPTVVQPVTPAPSGPPPKLTDGASAYRPAPPTPPPAPTRPPSAPPAPAPTTPPGVLDPITEPICTAVGVCLP